MYVVVIVYYKDSLCLTTFITVISVPFCMMTAAQQLLLFWSPWAWVHAFWLNVLQLTGGLHAPYFKKVLQTVSFGLQTCMTHNKHTVGLHRITVYLLTCLTNKNNMISDIANKKARNPFLLFWHYTHSVRNAKNVCGVTCCNVLLKMYGKELQNDIKIHVMLVWVHCRNQ